MKCTVIFYIKSSRKMRLYTQNEMDIFQVWKNTCIRKWYNDTFEINIRKYFIPTWFKAGSKSKYFITFSNKVWSCWFLYLHTIIGDRSPRHQKDSEVYSSHKKRSLWSLLESWEEIIVQKSNYCSGIFISNNISGDYMWSYFWYW